MKLTRRKFLVGTAIVGGGIAVGFMMRSKPPVPQTVASSFQPNAWLQLTSDGRVIFQLDKAEMGQGVYTSLTTIAGEALDFDPNKIEVEMAPPHSAYSNPALGMQVTGGSTSVTSSFEPLMEAGAATRYLLLQAAAKEWSVGVDELRTEPGEIIHDGSGKRAAYAEFVEAAKSLKAPTSVQIKEPDSYRWIGKDLLSLDAKIKTDGSAIFGADVELPNMKVARVIRCPHFGGSLKSFNAEAAEAIPGVKKVFAIHNGVAVVADGYWQASKAVKAITVEWEKGPLAGLDSAGILANQRNALENSETIVDVLNEGDADMAIANAGDATIEVKYSAPFLHHSTMEPQNCTALVTGDSCEIWAPNQAPDFVRGLAAQFGGFDPQKVTVHTTFLGGGFGRRAMTDFAGEAAAIAAKMPGTPIKVMWSREDDMQHDFYRPSTYHRVRGVVQDGRIAAWQHRLVSASIIKGMAVTLIGSYMPTWLPEKMAQGIGRLAGGVAAGSDKSMAEGAEIPYAVENKKVDVALYDPGIPLGFWRSVGHSHNAFVAESFMDEMAHAANADPVEFRLQSLKDHPRHTGVLKLVSEKASWGSPEAGRIQGVAVHESFASYVAQVVELEATNNGYKIARIVCAIDCGRIINPQNVVAQVESAIVYGLGGALKTALTISDGAVVESNFHNLPVPRINEIPLIETYIVESNEHPTGVGEVALPPVAPALANALFKATGNRQRDLPLSL